jgi:hypothetical protein
MKNLMILGSWFDVLPKLTDEQAGKLFKGFGKWLNGEEVTFDDAMLQGFWFGIEGNLNNMEQKYEAKANSNRENGKKGGRPKKTQDNPNNPNGFLITHDNPNNLKEKEKEKEKEKDNDIDMEMSFPLVEEYTEEELLLKELHSKYKLNNKLDEDDRVDYYELFQILKEEGYYTDRYKIIEYGIV